jgi:hypothetical protein
MDVQMDVAIVTHAACCLQLSRQALALAPLMYTDVSHTVRMPAVTLCALLACQLTDEPLCAARQS